VVIQPTPMAAIELIHKQPVRWTNKKIVSCDGGGGPLGHPRIYINTDKPEIVPCGYCGLPFVRFIISALIDKLLILLGPRAPPCVPPIPARDQLPP
jgi:NADH dehydrogenase (ubiquinone) Fe-S protein 6